LPPASIAAGNLLDDRAALVDDRGDVAGDARRRERTGW